MKVCTFCNLEKDKSAFNKHLKSPDQLNYWCKDCFKIYRKQKRVCNPQGYKDYNNKRRSDRVKWFQDLKANTPCVDCDKIYDPFCMDYDHVPENGFKIKAVSRMVLDNTPKEIILEEIKKCDLVCLLCHNKRTFDRFNVKLGTARKYKPNQIRNINIINEFKNKQCELCNIKYDVCNMQIDHIDPATKLYNVCDLKNYKEETLLKELEKCQVLCALCHRKKSIEEQQDGKYIVERLPSPKRIDMFYDPITNNKECGICHEIKKHSKFRKRHDTISGLDTYCKECFNKYQRDRNKK